MKNRKLSRVPMTLAAVALAVLLLAVSAAAYSPARSRSYDGRLPTFPPARGITAMSPTPTNTA